MSTKVPRRRAPAWAWMLLPLAVSALARDLWAPDEPRYAEVARELFETGDFLVMHLAGAVYPDKPPLLFWLAGLLGVLTDWWPPAMRLVSLGASAGTALLVARIAARWWGPAEARWAPVLLLGTAMWSEIGGRLQIDPLLALLCTGALASVLTPAAGTSAAGRHALLAGLLTGLAVLAKGPVALVVVALPLLAMRWAAGRASGARASRASLVGAALLALLPAVAWAAAAIASEPGLARELLYGQHVERVVEGRRHPGPPWRPLIRLPLLLLPWTAPVLAGLAGAFAARRRRRAGAPADDGLLRAAAWLLSLFVFFSLIPPKRDLYLLPAYPAAALLGARALAVWIARRRGGTALAWTAPPALALAGLALVVAGALPSVRARLGADLLLRGAVGGAALCIGAATLLSAARARDVARIARRTALTWALGGGVALAMLLPALDRAKSSRPLAERLAARSERPLAIPCLGVQPEGYRFYGRVPTTRDRDLVEALARDGAELLALVREEEWLALDPELRGRLAVAETARVGSRRIHVVVAAGAR